MPVAGLADGRRATVGKSGQRQPADPASTLAQTLVEALRQFRSRINSTLVLTLDEQHGEAVLREDLILAVPEPAVQAHELGLGVLVRLCRAVLGDGWSPRQVCLTSPAPAGSELAPFRRLLRCDLQFDAEFNALIFPASDLDRTGVLADPGMAAHARSLLDAAGRGAERSTREQAEWSIQLLLPVGRATIQSCAASLGLTVRTLQRRLDQEGAVFSDLLNAAEATAYSIQAIRGCGLPISRKCWAMARSLPLSRWDRQVFGEPPRSMRR
ncbi:MAG: AraC family transcriptional regulator ligand-binding domain-containing protein [Sphingomonadales bacterium]|nr:AraC family transcriptional regulator ligand-binding domain-containing protein [Sphingomonadales bacterium]